MTDMKKGIIPDEWVMPFILNICMTYKVFGAPGDRQTAESGHSDRLSPKQCSNTEEYDDHAGTFTEPVLKYIGFHPSFE